MPFARQLLQVGEPAQRTASSLRLVYSYFCVSPIPNAPCPMPHAPFPIFSKKPHFPVELLKNEAFGDFSSERLLN
ncbi:hypothetical protein [Nostoc linckia]|uniref:hypothetical protein n=1 Tax=Nostoc linckia TaxID=92942 RepID=UPI00117E939F|nr:hypothetical protein [Nostoc linckia]